MNNKDQRPTLVEFTGPAGVGKTFLKEKLLARFKEEGIACQDVQPGGPLRFLYTKPGFFVWLPTLVSSVRFVRATRPRNIRAFYEVLIRWHKAQVRMRRATGLNTGLCICCEGMLQKFRALRKRSRYKDEGEPIQLSDMPEHLVRQAILPDIVVILDTTYEAEYERRTGRGDSPHRRPATGQKRTESMGVTRADAAWLQSIKPGVKVLDLWYGAETNPDDLVEKIYQSCVEVSREAASA